MTGHPLAGVEQPGKHVPGRAKCARCPKMAAIRRMTRGPDGLLYGSGCARRLGYILPRPPAGGSLTVRGAQVIPGTLFDQPAREQPAMTQSATDLTTARRFVIEREDARIVDGIVWPDGSCSLRWRKAPRSFVSWDTFAECVQIQVDTVPGARVVWVDDDPAPVPAVPTGGELGAPTMPAGAAPSPDAQ